MVDQRLYQLYKPLRNHLDKLSIEESMYVIWGYINALQMGEDLPQDIECDRGIFKMHRGESGINEWELALLARQILILAEEYGPMARHRMAKWSYFTRAVNKLKDFENNTWSIFGGADNIESAMRRIAFQQFPWQANAPSTSLFLRYYKIYSHPGVSRLIEAQLGLSIQQWYTVGTAALGAYTTHCKLIADPEIRIGGLTVETFQKFFSYASTDLKGIQKEIRDRVVFNDQFIYAVNPLEYHPLILINGYYYCPILTFLGWRITSGIYYDLYDNPQFAMPYGTAYQSYIESVSRTIVQSTGIQVYGEAKYGTRQESKDSIDLIIADGRSAIFVEAKTIRRTSRLRTALVSNDEMVLELKRVADAIAQAYITIKDYLNGQYTHFPFKPELKVYPFVVMLEDIYVFGPSSREGLLLAITALLAEKRIPETFIASMPYTACSVEDFERVLQIIPEIGIEMFMQGWLPCAKRGDNFAAYLHSTYKEKIKPLSEFFPGDFEKIYPDDVMTSQ